MTNRVERPDFFLPQKPLERRTMVRNKIIYPEIRRGLFEKDEQQKDLAELLNLTESEISLKLHGKRKFKLEEIKLLCSHFEKDVNELFLEQRE